jgi:hypothetical protein
LKARKLIKEAFGWGKDIGLLRRPKLRDRRKVEFAALLTFTGYNLVRMRNLLAPGLACEAILDGNGSHTTNIRSQ